MSQILLMIIMTRPNKYRYFLLLSFLQAQTRTMLNERMFSREVGLLWLATRGRTRLRKSWWQSSGTEAPRESPSTRESKKT